MNHLASPEPEGKLTRSGDRGVGGDGGGVAGRGGEEGGREGNLLSGVTLSSEISWEEKRGEERRDFDEDGMDGDASVACLFSSLLLCLFPSSFFRSIDGEGKIHLLLFGGRE